jgi:ribonuclease HII
MAKKFDITELPERPNLRFETALWAQGCQLLAGLDEAGRGAWAGPVTAAAVVLPKSDDIYIQLNGVRDSKQMYPLQRAKWAGQIRASACAWGVGFASHEEIDALNIIGATRLAMQRALASLSPAPQHLIIDALALPEISLPQTCLIKGDARSLSVAAASILAKTARDEFMIALDAQFPEYGFARHKGYGTQAHYNALMQFGPTPVHRQSFAPLKSLSVYQISPLDE